MGQNHPSEDLGQGFSSYCAQERCLEELMSNLLLTCTGWTPSTSNGPEPISAIDLQPGCRLSPFRDDL
jgi:hypothetical protein